ncbi:mechanosensitive ion channel [Leptolyngbya sp. FACHB-1515]
MNETWQGMMQGVSAFLPLPHFAIGAPLAQAGGNAVEQGAENIQRGTNNFFNSLGFSANDIGNLLRALAILIIGLLIAAIAASIVRGILNRTNLDNRVARATTGSQRRGESIPIEKWISSLVFWTIAVLTIVGALQALNLSAVSAPLNNFVNQIISYIPKIIAAGILLAIAWVIATIVKLIVTRALDAFGIDRRLGDQFDNSATTTPPDPYQSTDPYAANDPYRDPYAPTDPYAVPQSTVDLPPGTTGATMSAPPPRPSSNQFSLSETIGNTLYWFIFLLFLPSILSALELRGTLTPVQNLLDDILSILPNVFAAVLIGAVGYLIAQVVRRIVTNFLAAAGTDRIGSRFGLRSTTGGKSLSWILGTVVFVLVLIPTAIAALNALRIDAISAPAILMLNQILSALPKIFTAGVILAIAYFVGQFLSDLVTNILSGLGFDNLFRWLGLESLQAPRQVPSTTPGATTIQQPTPSSVKTPSQIAGVIVLVGIMLFAAVAAINVLQIDALTALVSGIVVISGRILAGLIVFAIGLYFANLAFSLITSSGGRQSRILGQIARVSIIAFASALALQQMGIATDIVNLAFGLLLGSIAVAIALAFGLGGRDVAAEQLREWLASFRNKQY